MAWRASVGFAITASSLALGGASGAARADEAYLCGPDRVVYVAVEDLEAKKRSDPCIAAYYGLTVAAVVKTAAASAEPALAAPQANAAETISAELKSLSATEVPDRAAAKRERQPALTAPVAAPGTDFRNVHVINAASDDNLWFRHSK